jgi:hypothetical protein
VLARTEQWQAERPITLNQMPQVLLDGRLVFVRFAQLAEVLTDLAPGLAEDEEQARRKCEFEQRHRRQDKCLPRWL